MEKENWKSPLLVPGVDHFLTANHSDWKNSVNKIKTEVESSFFSQINEFLILS
jgi:hypothetical protein